MQARRTLPDEGPFSTGIASLDTVLGRVLPGDNVVWQVNAIPDYEPFVNRFVTWGRVSGRPVVYFRFASHPPLVAPAPGLALHTVHPDAGFEPFVGAMMDVIEREGPGALYVFDSLSELAADWHSDRMLGNFFMIICPFLYKLDTVAYFALLKKWHSFHATESIHQTAQVVLDVYHNRKHAFVQPVKVDGRSSPTMYMLHEWEDDDTFVPVSSSTTISDILAGVPQPWLDFTVSRPGIWMRTVQQAQKALDAADAGRGSEQDVEEAFQRLLRGAFTRDARFMALVRAHFDLGDLLSVVQRMIGTGLIGGKSLGMLLARAILRRKAPDLHGRFEAHDSFFVGSDVFYTYLVQNGCWHLRRQATDLSFLMQHNAEIQSKLLAGAFPDYTLRQFREMLDYFGQSPIIVRSSSFQEDSYGNAFSGKYETVFCANQGNPEARLDAFLRAVRTVYASTLSQDALTYRAQRGLMEQDEQMSLLVQRVSGELYGEHYFPQVAGVGFSFNPYVWNEEIDPRAGLLRLVFGLGTRAVERTSDDYTRLIALNAPERRPEPSAGDLRRYTQRQVDVLDLRRNALASRPVSHVAVPEDARLPMALFAEREAAGVPGEPPDYVLTFNRLIRETGFVDDMRRLLRALQDAYAYPVDIEFTANFSDRTHYAINIVQCRPLQVRVAGAASHVRGPAEVPPERLVLESAGPVIGQSTSLPIARLVYVVPGVYGRLSPSARYAVARAIGRVNRLPHDTTAGRLMLAGPGRWATSTPQLGVPVAFSEINRASVICEIAAMHEGLVPDVSLGTHFFNDLVELDMLYLAVAPGKSGHALNAALLEGFPNRLAELLPDAVPLAAALRVVESRDLSGGLRLHLWADCLKQRAACFLAP